MGNRGTGTLARLRRDRRGNTLAMMAIGMVPLIAMIGSGIDMTRAYMAQNRFRQACDAGSLAGRRLLSGTTVSDAVRSETTKFFQFNFPTGLFQSAAYTLALTIPEAGTLHVESETTIPTTIMKMFGFNTLPITASCSATQDFINTDIMMVFDLSGSMNCTPQNDSGGCSLDGVERTGSRLSALKAAAKSFYDTLENAQQQLHDANLRLRYGFVNYSSSVNVGWSLYAKNPDYLNRSPVYASSRWPNWVEVSAIVQGNGNCRNAYQYDSLAASYVPGATGVSGGYWENNPQRCWVMMQTAGQPEGINYGPSRGRYNLNMLIPTKVDATAYVQGNADNKVYVDVAPYVGMPENGSGNISDDSPVENKSASWAGCIEERKTDPVAINGGSATTAPATALDLDVDKIPDSDDSRWRPLWPEMVYWPKTRPASDTGHNDTWYANNAAGRRVANVKAYNGVPAAPCPTPARRLKDYYGDKSGFYDYIDSLKAEGGTYHDLGLIWGARFISPTGIFKSATPETNDANDPDNPQKIRGFTVKKYMIFMTDGELYPQPFYYSSYGVEALEGRVMGTPSMNQGALSQRHAQRVRMACNAAKSKGIDVWVIAFATGLTNDMRNCASKTTQAASLSTREELIAKFEEIGNKIGSLRLSQ